MRKSNSSKLAPVLRAVKASIAPAQDADYCNTCHCRRTPHDCIEPHANTPGVCCVCGSTLTPQPERVTCHLCGAPLEPDALTVQTAADGTPKLDNFYCRAHLIAGTEKLKAAIRAAKGA